MKVKTLLAAIMLLSLLSFQLKAEKVEKEEAENLAITFLREQIRLFSKDQSFDLSVNEVFTRDYKEIPVYHAINFSGGGYVIISADDRLKPVIGYAYEGAYMNENNPCCFTNFMDTRAGEAADIITAELPATTEVIEEWAQLRSGDFPAISPEAITDVQPLVMSPWNQDYPYNALCPPDPAGPGGHVHAGCVATAMSMIMYYYRYPEHGVGEKTHYSSYGPLYVNFGETYYDWDAMLNSITTSSGNSIPAVAELQYHCGVAVNMNYSPNGSGAQGYSVPGAVYTYFGYSSNVNFIQRQSYPYATWVSILKGQIDSGYPMYYQGFDASSGHAWVCDGYEEQGADTYFHMNWGWGGSGNGFFHLNNMNSGNGTFNSGHGIVRHFYPPTDSYPFHCSNDTHIITSSKGSIEDGSGPISNYQNNNNCNWLISPIDSVSGITLNFLKFETQPNDIVTIYDGETNADPVLGTFSGNVVPESVATSGNKMLITFETDNSGTAPGWYAEFTTALPVYCQGMISTTEPTGIIDDGSGPYNYNHNSFCRWFIKPEAANEITITFNAFDLEDENDYVQILQLPENITIGQFSGNTIPPPVTSTSNQVMVMFRSNNFYSAPGFNAVWTVDNVGVAEKKVFDGLNIFPNPASDLINLTFSTNRRDNIHIQLINAGGQDVYSEQINGLQGKYSRAMDVSKYPPGLYVIQVTGTEAKTSQKFIIE
jgi:hypothetical protein